MSDWMIPTGHISPEAMSLALDDLLDTQERRAMKQHLEHCTECRAEWAVWQQISHMFQVEPFVGPASGFALRVDSRISRHQVRRERLLGGLLVVGGTASIWAILLLGVVLTTAFWLIISPEARLLAASFVVFGGKLAALLIDGVTGWRNATLGLVPIPVLALLTGAIAIAFGAFMARLTATSVSGGANSGSASLSLGVNGDLTGHSLALDPARRYADDQR